MTLQKTVAADKELVCVTNNGPVLSVMAVGPDFIRGGIATAKDWAKKERVECVVFRGETSTMQLADCSSSSPWFNAKTHGL